MPLLCYLLHSVYNPPIYIAVLAAVVYAYAHYMSFVYLVWVGIAFVVYLL